MKMDIVTKRIIIYLGIVFAVYYTAWLIAVVSTEQIGQIVYEWLSFPVVFMGTPVVAVILTKKITKDDSPWRLDLKVWQNRKTLLFSALLPSAAVFLGAILFYLLFPTDLDYSGSYFSQAYAAYGVPADLKLTAGMMLLIGAVVLLLSAVALSSWLAALGEDAGWQGYLMPLLCKKIPTRYAVIVTGILWGLGHAPLIYFGMNYGLEYAGAPFAGIAMMVLFCMVVGVWMSYVTLKTNNCMYAAIIHGSVNIIGEIPVFVSLASKSTLLGPNPSGIIGMAVLILGSVILLLKMPDIKAEQ